jgi:probable HAF family extracellular repeat protein
LLTDLGTLGGSGSSGKAINASGRVTGNSATPGDASGHAFLYRDGQMLDLKALVDPNSPLAQHVVLTGGIAITDTGYILVQGYNIATGDTHPFLLSPVRAPGVSPSARTRQK